MSRLLMFMRRGPISPQLHGTLDYPLAAILIAGPLVLSFGDDVATVFVLVLGGAATVLAVGTDWTRGIIRVLPPVVHGFADLGATTSLIVAPFVLAYSGHTVATAFSIAVGAGGLAATLLTRFESEGAPPAVRSVYAQHAG
jgi:hypothetical protein